MKSKSQKHEPNGDHADRLRVTVSFNAVERNVFFEGAPPLTDAELVREALAIRPDLTPHALVRQGALAFARRIAGNTLSPAMRKAPMKLGAADSRIEKAFRQLQNANVERTRAGEPPKPITYSVLATAAKTNPATAKRWIARNPALFP
jgi:hypothetical protein